MRSAHLATIPSGVAGSGIFHVWLRIPSRTSEVRLRPSPPRSRWSTTRSHWGGGAGGARGARAASLDRFGGRADVHGGAPFPRRSVSGADDGRPRGVLAF